MSQAHVRQAWAVSAAFRGVQNLGNGQCNPNLKRLHYINHFPAGVEVVYPD